MNLAEGTSWEVAGTGFELSSSDKYSHSIIGKKVIEFLPDPLLIQDCVFESKIMFKTHQA